MTQHDVDEAYRDWERAAREAPVGGTPITEALWQRYCRMEDELNRGTK